MSTQRQSRARQLRWAGRAVVGVALCAITASAPAVDAESAKSVGTITYVDGTAYRAPGAAESWAALAKESRLQQGDKLKTAAGARLEAKLHDGSLLRLGENSQLNLDKVAVSRATPAKKKVKARLVIGRIWASVTKLFGDDSEFEVVTTNAVAGVRGTRFAAETGADGSVVKVYSGKVLVSNKPVYQVEGHTKGKRVQVQGPQEITKQQWTDLVTGAMQQVRIASNGDMSPAETFAAAAPGGDDWEKWNTERDALAGIKE